MQRRIFQLAIFISLTAALLGNGPASPDDYERAYPDFACDVDRGSFNGADITVQKIRELSARENGQEMIDRIYAQLTSGPMPAGFYNGSIVFAKSVNTELLRRFVATLGMPALNSDFLKMIGEKLWKGKIFKADPFAKQGVPSAILANKMPITDLRAMLMAMQVANPESMIGQANLTNQWRFPAKVFCGQSLLDSRRESIIIDYAHSESVRDADQNGDSRINYSQTIDQIADRNHLQIRDEIRMVRPGLYLGRAYLGRVFILNFMLECKEGECMNQSSTADACDIGGQRLAGAGPACMPMAQFRN